MPSPAEFDGWVRIGTAAKGIGVSADTLRRWERAGRISFQRRGSQRVIDADQLAALVRERAPTEQSSARNRPLTSSASDPAYRSPP